jgi:hypothetical protein
MKSTTIVVLTSLLAACASSNVIVRVPSPTPVTAQGVTPVNVQVNDLRAPGVAASTRQGAFGVPMGNVTFDPSERQLVKDALEAQLARRPQPQPTDLYVCDILDFGVNTNTTPLYWDVVGVIRLKLRKDGREQALSGTHTERTYLWPGADIIGRVVQESLRKAMEGVNAGYK